MNELNISKQLSELLRAHGTAVEEVTFHTGPNGVDAYAVVRDGYQLKKVDAGHVGAVNHVMHDPRSFADWLNRHAGDREKTQILFSIDWGMAVANLDCRNLDSDGVHLKLHTHPRLARWASAFDKPMSQKEFHRFLLAAKDDFANVEDAQGELVGTQAELIAGEVAKLNVRRDTEFVSDLDSRGNIVVQGATETTTISSRLPQHFTVAVPWFLGVEHKPDNADWDGTDGEVPEYRLEVWLDLDITGKQPVYTLTAHNIEEARHSAALDAVGHLRALLDDGFLVGLGEIRVGEVARRAAGPDASGTGA